MIMRIKAFGCRKYYRCGCCMLVFERAWELLGGEEDARGLGQRGVVQSCSVVADAEESHNSPMLLAPGSCGCWCCWPHDGWPRQGRLHVAQPRRCWRPTRAPSRWEVKLCHVRAPAACRINTSVCYRDTRCGVLKDNINKLGRAVSRLRRGLASRRSPRRGDHDH